METDDQQAAGTAAQQQLQSVAESSRMAQMVTSHAPFTSTTRKTCGAMELVSW
jgi:phosphoglycerate dehydrogenase-like enzyme